jgi:hypothetical protein
MRPDMGKIAVDAYRHGGYSAKKVRSKLRRGKYPADRLEMPTKTSTSRSRNGGRYPGEYLSPLYRWLAKQVGRRWDDVYSEVTQTLVGGYTNLEHIKSHIFDRVETGEVRIIDGWPHRLIGFRFGTRGHPWIEMRRYEMYVDDRGVLRGMPAGKTPHEKRRDRNRPSIIMLDAVTAAAKINGTWFAADLTPRPTVVQSWIDRHGKVHTYERPGPVLDALLFRLNRKKVNGHWVDTRSWNDPPHWAPYDTDKLYAASIRTMSKKEIKQRIPEKFR